LTQAPHFESHPAQGEVSRAATAELSEAQRRLARGTHRPSSETGASRGRSGGGKRGQEAGG